MLMHTQTTFSTSNLEDWSYAIKNTFGGLEITTNDPETFHGLIEVRVIEGFRLAMVKASPSKISHPGSIGAFSENERFLVKTQFSGHSRIRYNDHMIELAPGDMVICDNSRNYVLEFDEKTEVLSIPIPAKFLARFFSKPEDLTFKKPENHVASYKILGDFIKSLWNAGGLRAENEQSLQLFDMYFDILVMCFHPRHMGVEGISSSQSALLQRCKEYIEENLVNEDLKPDNIASALGISRRNLYTIFSKSELSVTEYIFSRRIDRAAQMLRSKRFKKKSIAEIAFDCGFKSTAHFSRSFKAKFYITPSVYRARDFHLSVGSAL